MSRTGIKLLWGTANLFSHPRYAAGAATNPDPEVFAYAAAQVKAILEATKRLDGANYVLWGGREGYETLLNTDLAREEAAARPLPEPGRRPQAPDRLQGHAADRAQAAGADQAPVRLRRRRRSWASSSGTASTRSTGSTSRSTTPRWPATASTTRWPTPSPTASSAASTRTAATTRTAGTPTSSRTRSTSCRWRSTRSSGRRVHDRRLQLRHQAAAPEHGPDRPVPCPHRRDRHAGPVAPGRRRHDRIAATLERLREPSATPAGAATSAGRSCRATPILEDRWPAGSPSARSTRSPCRVARSCSRTWSTSRSGRRTAPGGWSGRSRRRGVGGPLPTPNPAAPLARPALSRGAGRSPRW